MEESRRNFLKGAGIAAVGLGCTFPLLRAFAVGEPQAQGEGAETGQLCMVIDIEKCLNEDLIKACTEACRREHNLPPGEESDPERLIRWMWTQDFEHTFPDQAHSFTPLKLIGEQVPVMCNHCTSPACVKVCPTKATWKRKSDGLVMMDMHRCIGCRYCVVACPYGSRSFNWRDPRLYFTEEKKDPNPNYPTRMRGVVEKCTFCAERLRVGREPACVEAANEITAGAMTFGELSDPDSKVSKLLSENRTISRQNALGTGPNVYYIV